MMACNARWNFIPEARGASAIDTGATIAAVTAEAISTDAAATQKASVPAAGSRALADGHHRASAPEHHDREAALSERSSRACIHPVWQSLQEPPKTPDGKQNGSSSSLSI